MNPLFALSTIYQILTLTVGLAWVFSSATAQPVATVSVGPYRPFNPDWVGVNANLTSVDKPGENDALVAAIQTMRIKTIRYPGGTIGNYWDWDRGWIDATVPDSLMIPWVVTQGLTRSEQRYTLEDLHRLTQRTGTVPIFMLNMLSQGLEHSLRNLRRAQALGMPIRYVELGNELYFDLPFPKQRYPTPEVYGDTCQRWIAAIKREFPQARCAVVGNYLDRHDRQVNWTERILRHCRNADAVTFHRYSPPGLDGRQEKKRITAGTEGTADDRTVTRPGPTSPEERQPWERAQLPDPAAWANVLTTASRAAQTYRQVHAPDTMAIWVTEFNMRGDRSVMLHGWSHALVLATYYLEFLDGPVALTAVHNLVGHLFGQVHTDTANFSHVVDRKVKSVPYTLTAGGLATSLFAQATEGATAAAPLTLRNVPQLTDDRGATVASLRGWTFTREVGDQTTLVVNFGQHTAAIRWPAAWRGASMTSYYANLADPVNGKESVTQQLLAITSEADSLPPCSITLIRHPSED